MAAIWLLLVASLFLGSTRGGLASSCISIVDQDLRYECQAIERGDPSVCVSMRNADRRNYCRVQAEQARQRRTVR